MALIDVTALLMTDASAAYPLVTYGDIRAWLTNMIGPETSRISQDDVETVIHGTNWRIIYTNALAKKGLQLKKSHSTWHVEIDDDSFAVMFKLAFT